MEGEVVSLWFVLYRVSGGDLVTEEGGCLSGAGGRELEMAGRWIRRPEDGVKYLDDWWMGLVTGAWETMCIARASAATPETGKGGCLSWAG